MCQGISVALLKKDSSASLGFKISSGGRFQEVLQGVLERYSAPVRVWYLVPAPAYPYLFTAYVVQPYPLSKLDA